MSTKRITKFLELKKKYPNLYEEIKDSFKKNHQNIKNYDLDYFVLNNETNEFYLSMSSGHIEQLLSFDMKGEIFEDEVAIFDSSFSKETGKENEDLYDTERTLLDEQDHDIDY